MIYITICVEEVGVFLIFVDMCIPYFEEILVWAFMSFVNFISLVHYVFMWMVHEIFHAMFESKKICLCWCVHVFTEAHGDILKIIACLDGDVHESTNLVME